MNVISFYRLSRRLYDKGFFRTSKFITRVGFLIFNSHIPGSAKIGKYSKASYGGSGVIIHKDAIVGERVLFGQGTTIGRQLDPSGVPRVGDDVYISTGAKILGDVRVGNNVIIGANAVVIRDVPDNSVVAGVPAKLIKTLDQPIYDLLKGLY